MKRKSLYVLASLTLAVVVFTLVVHRFKPKVVALPDANILLITIDTIRPDRLSCYGSPNKTPNIDEVARNGILFENAFCQVPLTFPSHTSILTGLFPIHHGTHNNGLEIFAKHDFLITDLFRRSGYKTGAVVSSFVLDRKFGLADGFDVYDDRMERLPTISSNFDVERRGDESCDSAIRILDSFGTNKWFLWLHFYDPHTPYSPPEPQQGYDGEITFVDQQIGKLLGWLKTKKLDQNLILAVLGDHGESLGEHGEQTHGFFVYNSTLKIPMLLSYPNAPSGKRIATAAASVDLAATCLQLAGIQDTKQRDGESLVPLIQGKKRQRDIYFESNYPQLLGWNGLQGIFHEEWKLISTTRSELYDWQKDGIETSNLITQKEAVSRSLKKTLQQFEQMGSGSAQQPDAETLEKLKSLGYISTTNVAAGKGTADPKDQITVWAEYERYLQLRNSGKSAEALDLLKSLTSREPKNNFFRVSLASAYRESGNLAAAVPELEAAIQNDPSDADAYHELALAQKEQRNFAEAIRAEEAALALQPSRSEFHSMKGILLVETGRFEKAKEEFRQVLKIDPNNAVAWNNYGNALRETGYLEQAAEAYRKAMEQSPHYAYPLNGFATILIRQDKTKEAIPYLEKAIELDPKFVEVYLNLGIAYHTLKETQKAKTLYRTFLKISPGWMQKERENAGLLLSQIP